IVEVERRHAILTVDVRAAPSRVGILGVEEAVPEEELLTFCLRAGRTIGNAGDRTVCSAAEAADHPCSIVDTKRASHAEVETLLDLVVLELPRAQRAHVRLPVADVRRVKEPAGELRNRTVIAHSRGVEKRSRTRGRTRGSARDFSSLSRRRQWIVLIRARRNSTCEWRRDCEHDEQKSGSKAQTSHLALPQ